MKWWLDRQGVVGRVRDESAMDTGTLFHAKMANHWNGLPIHYDTGMSEQEELVLRAGRKVIDQEGAALEEKGIVCVECVLGGSAEEIARHGRYPGTADLVTQNATGLSVTDYKTKMALQPAYVDAELRQTQRSWQFKQYAYYVQEKYKQPVTQVRKLLVAFKPTLRVWLATYPVTQQELSLWYEQACTVWALMDDIEIGGVAWQNADACERYGWQYRCDFAEICWDGKPIEYKESAQ